MSWNSYDINNSGTPWGANNTGTQNNGMGFGGVALAAGAGAVLGNALLGGGLGGANTTKDVAVETSKQVGDLQGSMFANALAAADRGYQQTIAFNHQLNTVDRDVLTTTYDTSRQMCQGFYDSNTTALQAKYENALQLAMLGYQQEKCCCETNTNIMKMGYETQLRDQNQYGMLMAEILKTQCLVKDSEKDSIMREQAAKICNLENRITKEEIIAAMKPVAPVPAYIQANPYENFKPVVHVDRHHCDSGCEFSWGR